MKRTAILAGFVFVLVVVAATAVPVPPAAAEEKLFLGSAMAFDPVAGTITLPLFMGMHKGSPVWYVVTDSSDREDAEARGVNFSPKLANATVTAAVQKVSFLGGGVVEFPGTVDFAPARLVVPGPTGFPPAAASPGSVGDALYSPLFTTGNGIVLNAPHVANDTGLHDKVLNIDFAAGRVTLALTEGRYHGKGIWYLSTDASDPAGAALEASTFAPNLNEAPGLASDDPLTSARAAIIPIVNGPLGADNPERQGLASAVLGEGSPLNITIIHPRNRGKIPTYSPLWDVHPAVWTDAAIAAGERRRLNHHEDVIDGVDAGRIASGGAGPANPDLGGLRAAGIIVNCPVMALFGL